LSCYHFRKRITEYQGGELEEHQAAAMEAHLRSCAACRRELALLESEASIYEAYAARVESALDPSPEICERAMERAASQPRPARNEDRPAGQAWGLGVFLPVSSWARQALAAAILVALSVTATLLLVDRYRSKEAAVPSQAAIKSSGEKSLDAALRSIQRAEQEYLDAIRVLSAIVEKQKATIDPRMLAEFQRNLKMIDEHIAATRSAYYAYPSDPELAFYMLAAYSRKVEMLQDLAS
jgi:hypothetical protein